MSQSTKKKGQVIDRLITDLICNDRQHRRCGLMMLKGGDAACRVFKILNLNSKRSSAQRTSRQNFDFRRDPLHFSLFVITFNQSLFFHFWSAQSKSSSSLMTE
jgi:hypothetical protein